MYFTTPTGIGIDEILINKRHFPHAQLKEVTSLINKNKILGRREDRLLPESKQNE